MALSDFAKAEESGAQQQTPPADAQQQTPTPDGDKQQQTPPSGDRPEWLPEKFQEPAALAAAYSELEKKLGSKEEDFRKSFQEELLKERPATAGDYVVPDSISDEDAVNSDLLKWWAETSFEKGFSQEMFQTAIEKFFDAYPTDDGPDPKAEIAKLGENANQRMAAVDLWVNKEFAGEQLDVLNGLLGTAAGYEVVEKLMSKKGGQPGQGEDQTTVGLTEAKLREMQNDPRYYDPVKRDMAFVKQVQDGWAKLYA